jgi:alanine racemase
VALRALAEVNLAAIERNVTLLRSRAGGAELCAVVKADAYGHGAPAVAAAALAADARMLAVATAAEALELREAGLVDASIMILGAISDEELPLALAARAELTVWSLDFVAAIGIALATGGGSAPVRVHVKLDSGMGRLGTRSQQTALAVAAAADRGDGVELVGVTTHFATSDGDLGFAREQLERFTRFIEALGRPGLTVHAANSGATLRMAESHFDMVRCGIALYGGDPMNADPGPLGLEPALSLSSYVAAIKRIEPGESAGCGRRFIATAPTYLATVPIGYGDGVRRGLTNNADVLIRGRRYPVVGTVSMDNITVEVGRDPALLVGDRVTLIGADGDEHITAEEVAHQLDTINYEVLCGISGRVPRRYHRDGMAL